MHADGVCVIARAREVAFVGKLRDDLLARLEAIQPGELRTGSRVNLEVDLLARYIERLLLTGDSH